MYTLEFWVSTVYIVHVYGTAKWHLVLPLCHLEGTIVNNACSNMPELLQWVNFCNPSTRFVVKPEGRGSQRGVSNVFLTKPVSSQ